MPKKKDKAATQKEVSATKKEAPKKVVDTKETKVESTPEMPSFEGVKVKRIIKDNKSNETHFHCKMADQTTRHVPKNLFK